MGSSQFHQCGPAAGVHAPSLTTTTTVGDHPFVPTVAHWNELSQILDLPEYVKCTALIFWHRVCDFYHREYPTSPSADPFTHHHLPPLLLMASCIHLACKYGEVTRKVRDIVNCVYYVDKRAELNINDNMFWEAKDALISAEMLILRILGFSLNERVGLVHHPLIDILQSTWRNQFAKNSTSLPSSPITGGQSITDTVKSPPEEVYLQVCRVAWSFACDAYFHPAIVLPMYAERKGADGSIVVTCTYTPIHLALACTYLALRAHGCTLFKPFREWIAKYSSPTTTTTTTHEERGAEEDPQWSKVEKIVQLLVELYMDN